MLRDLSKEQVEQLIKDIHQAEWDIPTKCNNGYPIWDKWELELYFKNGIRKFSKWFGNTIPLVERDIMPVNFIKEKLKDYPYMEQEKKYYFYENFYLIKREIKGQFIYGIGTDPDRKEYYGDDDIIPDNSKQQD